MYIKRDMTALLSQSPALIQILLGPRQCGKSTLFAALTKSDQVTTHQFNEITFDDLQLRELANRDPALFLEQFDPPLLLDEVQYVPNLFPELKKKIDLFKRNRVFEEKEIKKNKVLYRLTGSNQILMDKNIKESLAGRAAYYHLNTLSVHEILNAIPDMPMRDILYKGGWPELYSDPALSVIHYLNDYIRSYIEKDIMMSAGVHKLAEFLTVLRLCAARTAQEIDFTDIQKDSGVSSVTVKEWISVLERAGIIYLLKPYFNNLNKRLIKRSKLYFLDTGLAARLQGWTQSMTLLSSPHIGALFETLVVGEFVKFICNYGKDWELFFWRTKEGEEIDMLLKTADGNLHAFEVKYAIHGISQPFPYPRSFQKLHSPTHPLMIITFGGKKIKLSPACEIIPIQNLHQYLNTLT